MHPGKMRMKLNQCQGSTVFDLLRFIGRNGVKYPYNVSITIARK